MRRAGSLSVLIVAALCAGVLAGCGGGSDSGSTAGEGEATAPGSAGATAPQSAEPAGAATQSCGPDGLKATGVDCGAAKAVFAGWRAAPGCAVVDGGSHASCRVRGYACIAAAVGRGTAVSCALPERSIFFLVPR